MTRSCGCSPRWSRQSRNRSRLRAAPAPPWASSASPAPSFELAGERRLLELYWLEAYGGGIFVPFGDATNGSETYGPGRYVLATAA
jgi:uncharacterized protein (DUF1684 family)